MSGGLTLYKLAKLFRDTRGALAGAVMNGTESLFLRALCFAGGDGVFAPKEAFLGALGGVLITLVLSRQYSGSSF